MRAVAVEAVTGGADLLSRACWAFARIAFDGDLGVRCGSYEALARTAANRRMHRMTRLGHLEAMDGDAGIV